MCHRRDWAIRGGNSSVEDIWAQHASEMAVRLLQGHFCFPFGHVYRGIQKVMEKFQPFRIPLHDLFDETGPIDAASNNA